MPLSANEQVEKGMRCLDVIRPPEERKRRAELARDLLTQLSRYRDFLQRLESGDDCPGLRAQLVDRAFEAEGHARVLIAETLTALNDLRDAGLLHAGLKDFSQWVAREKNLNLAARLRAAQDREGAAAFPPGALAELATNIERRNFDISYDEKEDALALSGRALLDGTSRLTHVRLEPRPGDIGRVGVNEFFGVAAGQAFHAAQPPFAPPGCHHREPVSSPEPVSVDPYGSALATLAYTRELMYRHARKVREYGHAGGALRANDPVGYIIGAFVLLVAGVMLIVNGAAGNDVLGLGNPAWNILFGVVLIIGAIMIIVWLALL